MEMNQKSFTLIHVIIMVIQDYKVEIGCEICSIWILILVPFSFELWMDE